MPSSKAPRVGEPPRVVDGVLVGTTVLISISRPLVGRSVAALTLGLCVQLPRKPKP